MASRLDGTDETWRYVVLLPFWLIQHRFHSFIRRLAVIIIIVIHIYAQHFLFLSLFFSLHLLFASLPSSFRFFFICQTSGQFNDILPVLFNVIVDDSHCSGTHHLLRCVWYCSSEQMPRLNWWSGILRRMHGWQSERTRNMLMLAKISKWMNEWMLNALCVACRTVGIDEDETQPQRKPVNYGCRNRNRFIAATK